MSNINIAATSSYMGLDSWVMANIIQLATFSFCRRFLNKQNDPAGRMFDQMTQAARSIQANIAEGSARSQTSSETQMKLLDVARASASELAGDFMFIIMARGECAWLQSDPNWESVYRLQLDKPVYGKEFLHDVTKHILNQEKRFAPWIESDDISMAANALLLLCTRVISMLKNQISRTFETFKKEGGFTENLTRARLESKSEAENAPLCPKCGAKMTMRTVQKGSNHGAQFWGCINYPRCNGVRNI